MGDRISISFRHKQYGESPAFFSHWDGMGLVKCAKEYLRNLKAEQLTEPKHVGKPLDRLEPRTVMVDFIREFTLGAARVESNYYLESDSSKGDNSDNGHHYIDLDREG